MAVELGIKRLNTKKNIFDRLEDPAHELMLHGFKPIMAKALAAIALHGRLPAKDVPQVLDQVFYNQFPRALRQVAEYSKPVGIVLEKAGLSKEQMQDLEELNRLTLPKGTARSMQKALSGCTELIAKLSRLKRLPVKDKARTGRIFALLQSVAHTFQTNGKNSLPALMQLMQGTLGSPAFTVPHRNCAQLYFLTHLPESIRYAIQGTLLDNNTLDYLGEAVAKSKDKELKKALEALKLFYCYRQFSSHHWNALLEEFSAPSEFVVRMGALAGKAEQQLKVIAEMPKAAELLKLEQTFHSLRRKRAGKLGFRLKAEYLQHIDTGHCFKSDHDLHAVADRLAYPKEFRKDGRLALVFEDEQDQAKNYRELIQDCTPLEAPADGRLCTDSAETVLRAVRNEPKIGLYLLDISQPKEEMAGIKLAKQLLLELARFLPKLPEEPGREPFVAGRPRTVHVVVWSSSAELKKVAEQELERFIKREKTLKKIAGGNSGSSEDRIEVRCHLKSETWFLRYLK